MVKAEAVLAVAAPEEETPAVMPCGYKVLVRVQTPEERYGSGLWKTAHAVEVEQESAMIGEVCLLGPDAYRDEKRFPNGSWCKPGDWVMFRAHMGTRIRLAEGSDVHYRLLNDDSIEAVLTRPKEVKT